MIRVKQFDLKTGLEICKAFSDEARLRILNLIFHHQEMCISDLETILDFTQTKTSRHLIYLKNSGLLKSKKHNQWVYYSIKETYLEVIAQLLSFLEKDALLVEDQQQYKTLYSNNELAIRRLHNSQKKYKLPAL